jgi:hypothetical protein
MSFISSSESERLVEGELIKLGFDFDLVQRLIAYYRFTDLTIALEYVIKG